MNLRTFLPAALGGLALSTFASLACAQGRDLPRNDPDRQAILDAARGDQPNVRFVVKDLAKFGPVAYLCALISEEGALRRTDESIEVYQYGLIRVDGRWRAVEAGGNFTDSAKKVPCNTEEGEVASADDIRSLLKRRGQDAVQRELDFAFSAKLPPPMFDELVRGGILAGVDIEHAKQPFDKDQLRFAVEKCSGAGCQAAQKEAFAALKKWEADAGLSSLVWENCRYGLRVFSMTAIRDCMAQNAARPQCRPHLEYPKDSKTIDACVDGLRKTCHATFKDAPTRSLACSG
jgi:hypothetical protein